MAGKRNLQMFGLMSTSTTTILTLDDNNLPVSGVRCYQVISILSSTKSILSAHLYLDG